MTDILTEEEVQATLNQIKETEEQFGHLADEYDIDCTISHESLKKIFSTIESLQAENQALQAQNKRLVEALENMEAAFSSMHYDSHDVKKCPYDYCQKCDGFHTIMQAREALEAWEGGQ